jgi:hypothetical protein
VDRWGIEPHASRLQGVSVPQYPALRCCNFSGPGRDRTGYLLHAMQALSQVSYEPSDFTLQQCSWKVSNLLPLPCQGSALPVSYKSMNTSKLVRVHCEPLTYR